MRPLRVLVIDDVDDVRRYIARALERRACVVATAGDAAEAFVRCAESTFDLILLDRRLPDGPGTAAVPELRRLCPGASIVVMSGTRNSERDALGLPQLPKPVDFTALEALLDGLRAGLASRR